MNSISPITRARDNLNMVAVPCASRGFEVRRYFFQLHQNIRKLRHRAIRLFDFALDGFRLCGATVERQLHCLTRGLQCLIQLLRQRRLKSPERIFNVLAHRPIEVCDVAEGGLFGLSDDSTACTFLSNCVREETLSRAPREVQQRDRRLRGDSIGLALRLPRLLGSGQSHRNLH